VYTARDVGRIVAYARNDGASDTLLWANILQAFGLRTLQCTAFKIFDVLNTAVFLTAILTILKGLISLIKFIKIIGFGKKSKLTLSVIELLWPKAWSKSLAAFLFWTGSAEVVVGGTIVFVTAIANNVALYLLMKDICGAEVAPLSVDVQTLDTGNLQGDIVEFMDIFKSIIDENK